MSATSAIKLTGADLIGLAPVIILTIFAVVLLLVEVFGRRSGSREHHAYMGLVVVGLAMATVWIGWCSAPGAAHTPTLFSGMLVVDGFSRFFFMTVLIGTALVLMMSPAMLREHGVDRGEYYALVLLSASGMLLMVAAADLIMVFIGLEVMSIAIYVLAGWTRERPKAMEASLKYFLLGAFSSAILLYGVALVYGTTGSTSLTEIAVWLGNHPKLTGHPLFLIGVMLILVGFGFKVAAVPFHMWTPDVYEGAPTAVTGFMAVGVKATAFAAFLRVFFTSFGGEAALQQVGWGKALVWLAILTMVVANLVALRQDNIKRMLAYSSIAHAGYLLAGVVAAVNGQLEAGISAVLYYLLVYVFMNLGAFGVIIYLEKKNEGNLDLKDYAGVARKHPMLGLAMAIFIFSLAGIPPTAGFFGKFYLVRSIMDAGQLGLAIVLVLNSVVSVYYYLRVLVYMFMEKDEKEIEIARSTPLAVSLLVAVLAVVGLGLLPSKPMALAKRVVREEWTRTKPVLIAPRGGRKGKTMKGLALRPAPTAMKGVRAVKRK